MESKKNRFQKGSEEAKQFMAELRAKRGKKGGGSTPPPPPSSPVNCECPPTEKPKTKRSNKKHIVVDF
jgi:hypothetical protein